MELLEGIEDGITPRLIVSTSTDDKLSLKCRDRRVRRRRDTVGFEDIRR